MRYSIIVPIYKTEKYIRQCVDSILQQSDGDFEVILVDDGSPDNCPAIVDEYAAKDKRVVAVHKKNGGLVSARKAGAAAAKGDYVVNVDSDDYIRTDLLQRISQLIDRDAPDAVFYGYTVFRDDGEVIREGTNMLSPGVYRGEAVKDIMRRYMYDKDQPGMNGGAILFNVCAKAVKREIYVKSQELVPDSIVSGEDTMFTMNLLRNMESVTVTDFCGYWYRQNPTSIEHTVTNRDLKNLTLIFAEMQRVAREEPLYSDQVYVYALYRLWVITIRAAICAKRYAEFCQYVNDPCYDEINRSIQSAAVHQPRVQDRLVIAAVKNKWFWLIYLLGKTWFRNKDMM